MGANRGSKMTGTLWALDKEIFDESRWTEKESGVAPHWVTDQEGEAMRFPEGCDVDESVDNSDQINAMHFQNKTSPQSPQSDRSWELDVYHKLVRF